MTTLTYKTPHDISVLGFSALIKDLGPGGAVQFIKQYETGKGNYTQERKKLFSHVSLNELRNQLLKK
jgi:hypothetical protein